LRERPPNVDLEMDRSKAYDGVSCENAGTNIQPPGSQIGRKVIIWTVWCQIETDQHRRGLNYGSTGCTGGSECFLGEKRPNLDKIMRNDETTACKCAETQVWGKGV
jgi:hypothetical protein